MNNSNNIMFGLMFAVVNALMLSGMSLFSKLLSEYFGPAEVTFFRNIISVFVLLLLLSSLRKLYLLKTERPYAHIIRSVIGTTGIVIGNWALSMMPLAETTILLFTSPLWVVLLSYPILKEPVGILRLAAVCIGFVGIIITINPSSDVQNLPTLGIALGLIWGFLSAAVSICLRWMGKTENPMATTFYFVAFGTIATGFHWPWAEIKETSFSIDAFVIIMGLGLTGVTALVSKSQSYRMAKAAIISPVMYSMIIWSILFDYMFWEKEPTINALVGAAIIISSNLFILYRETHLGRNKANIPENNAG